MSEDGDDLRADYLRIVTTKATTVLQVGVVTWSSPADPGIRWKAFRRWRKPPSPAQIKAAQDLALRDPRFFAWCRLCEELHSVGHMSQRDVCQSCATRHLQVVF